MSAAREIYAFPSGRLLAEHCAAFGAALAQLWPERELSAAVVLEPRSDPALGASELGARAYDDSHAQGVLSYPSLAALLDNLRPLFLNAEPELFFVHRDDWSAALARAGRYIERERDPSKPRGLAAWLERVSHSALCRHDAPLVVHAADGRCFAVERAS